jgi:hypothetical protein
MGINPVDNKFKERFGVIYYQNNGDNLTEFNIVVPITVEYYWGWLTRYQKIHFYDTRGNHHDHQPISD